MFANISKSFSPKCLQTPENHFVSPNVEVTMGLHTEKMSPPRQIYEGEQGDEQGNDQREKGNDQGEKGKDLLSADLPPCAAGGRWSNVLVLVVQHLVVYFETGLNV